MKYCVLFILFVNLSFGQKSLTITKPSKNDRELSLADEQFTLKWVSEDFSTQTKINIDYATEESNWITIDTIAVGKEMKRIYLEDDLGLIKGSKINEKGQVWISIHQGRRYRNVITLTLPEVATHGRVKFVNGKKSIDNNDITIKYDRNKIAKIEDVITLKVGSHDYTATVDQYGDSGGYFSVEPGKTKTIKIDIIESWGDVVFRSFFKSDLKLVSAKKRPPRKKSR